MPARLRPTAPIAPDAVLVGDPGRALMLAQVLLAEPKMSNHARGLWGYSGLTPAGRELTIQSTGMGGPSAAVVLADLAELGVRRAIRVGTCTGARRRACARASCWRSPRRAPGAAAGGPGASAVAPDPELERQLRAALGESAARGGRRQPRRPPPRRPATAAGEGEAADMQTAALFARGRELGVAVAAVLVVAEAASGGARRRGGWRRRRRRPEKPRPTALSNPQVEG